MQREEGSDRGNAETTLTMGRQKFSYTSKGCGPPYVQIMNLTQPVVPGRSYPTETEDGLIDLKTEKLDMTCCEKSLCNKGVKRLWMGEAAQGPAWALPPKVPTGAERWGAACDPDLHPPCPIPSQGLECFQCYGVLDLSLCHPSPTPCRLKAAPPLWSLALPMGRNSATLARAVPRPCAQIMNLTHPVVPGGSYPIETEDGLTDLKTEKLDMTCCEKSLCNKAATVQRGLWGLAVRELLLSLGLFFGPCCEPSPPWHCPGG
ncbi:hypothetical protein H8959_004154 [Pygathrix nigripes]